MNRDPSQQAYAVAVGTTSTNYPIFDKRDPTPQDIYYPLGKFWINQTGLKLWYLNSQSNASGVLLSNWQLIANSTGLQSISDTSGGVVYPTSINNVPPQNIQLVGTNGITITANPGSNLLTVAGSNSTFNLAGDTGTATGSTITQTAKTTAGASVTFNNTGSTSRLNVTDGNNNTTVGAGSSNASASGPNNAAFGYQSLNALTNGTQNAYFGFNCGQHNTSGSYNNALGAQALVSLTTGGNNVAMGNLALNSLLTGANNVVLGSSSGTAYNGSETGNIIVGYGIAGTAAESNVMRLGASSTSKSYIRGINTTAPSALTTPNLAYVDTTSGLMASSPNLITAPPASSASTLALGTNYQNVLGYDVMVVVYFQADPGVNYILNLGVGPSSSPTQQTIYNANPGSLNSLTVPIYIPKGYYALLSSSGAGTPNIVGQIAMPI